MPVIELTTIIRAPVSRCFDLSRSIDLHKISTRETDEEAISGVTSGLIGLNETVTWRARHFGVYQKLTTRITEFEFPSYFVDEMEKGIFSSMRHEHHFETMEEGTLMKDHFQYTSPMLFLGTLADVLFLSRYMTRLLKRRNETIKHFAESEEWKKIL